MISTSVKLGDVIEIYRGGSPRPIENFITEDSDGLNWIKIGDVGIGEKYIEKTKEKIKKEGISKTRQVYAGDFLLSNSMSFGRPYITKIDGCIHDGWLTLRDTKKLFDKDFLYHLLSSQPVKAQFAKFASGAVVKNLNIDAVSKVTISIPPLAEQKRIAELLDTADGIIRLREQAIAKLDELALSKFNEMDGRAVKHHKLSEICEIVSGATPKTDNKKFWNGDICWVTPRELSDMTDIYISDTERKITSEGKDSCAVSVLPINSVLFSSRAPIGHLAINTVPMTTNQGFKSFVVNENIVKPLYLYYWLKSRKVKIQNLGVGATFKEVSKSIVSSIEISLPAVQMQDAFQSDVLKIRDMKIKQMNSLKKLQNFVASLQHQSFAVN